MQHACRHYGVVSFQTCGGISMFGLARCKVTECSSVDGCAMYDASLLFELASAPCAGFGGKGPHDLAVLVGEEPGNCACEEG